MDRPEAARRSALNSTEQRSMGLQTNHEMNAIHREMLKVQESLALAG
jgi:hypothetical protein